MDITPLTLKEARHFVDLHHRHHKAPQGGLFAIGLSDNNSIIGVAIIGRPVSRMLDNGFVAEVTRLCVLDNYKNACSKLYAASWRIARELGYRKCVTYILNSESGTSITAAGWTCVGECRGGSWSVPSRPRVDKHPLQGKLKFEIGEGK